MSLAAWVSSALGSTFQLAPTLPTSRQAGSRQVDVGEEVRHRASLGDLLGFGQMLLGEGGLAADEVVERGGQQAAGKVVHLPCGAEAVDGGGDVRQVERRLRGRGIGFQPVRRYPSNGISGGRGSCRAMYSHSSRLGGSLAASPSPRPGPLLGPASRIARISPTRASVR